MQFSAPSPPFPNTTKQNRRKQKKTKNKIKQKKHIRKKNKTKKQISKRSRPKRRDGPKASGFVHGRLFAKVFDLSYGRLWHENAQSDVPKWLR